MKSFEFGARGALLMTVAMVLFTGCKGGTAGQQVADVCTDSHYMREGVDRALGALKGLKLELERGRLTEASRNELCEELADELSGILGEWRPGSRPGGWYEERSDGHLPLSYILPSTEVRRPDAFFYDDQTVEYTDDGDATHLGSYEGNGSGIAFLIRSMIEDNLIGAEERCVAGEEWVTRADGVKERVVNECLRKEEFEVRLPGHDVATALKESVKSLGGALAAVCGSGRIKSHAYVIRQPRPGQPGQIGISARYGEDVAAAAVGSAEFSAAVDEGIALIERDILTSGVSAYLAIECSVPTAFAELGGPRGRPGEARIGDQDSGRVAPFGAGDAGERRGVASGAGLAI